MAKEQTPPTIKEQPKLPSEVEAVIEEYHVDTFHNRGYDTTQYNHFRAATEKLKVRLAAVLTSKE